MKGDVDLRYIGSKSSMLCKIERVLDNHIKGDEESFLDLFAGTNVVGKHFKNRFRLVSNDLLYFSYLNAKATIENNEPLHFANLGNITSPLDYLQKGADEYLLLDSVGYYERAYSPSGEAMYLSVENAKRIDFIRDKIDEWNEEGLLTEPEYCYLVSALIEAIPFVSNITGTYGAFLKHWDKRALKALELTPLVVEDNGFSNSSFNVDSNDLVHRIEVDIAYIDTPYNTRQYASNYHLLENVARNEKPSLIGKTKIFDWSDQRSDYAMKRRAVSAMTDLLSNINARHVLISYNNEGIIAEKELLSIVERSALGGTIEVHKIPARKYKSKVPSKSDNLYELLIYFKKREDDSRPCGQSLPRRLKKKKWSGEKEAYLKSPLNYIGGKHRLLGQIIPLFPNKIDTFVDLFSGGANVGINVKAKQYIFNDMNHRVNEMFRFFSGQNEDDLVDSIRQRIEEWGLSKTDEKAYKAFRTAYNNSPNPLDLYILVSFSYNYQFRFNNSMEFNNPFGRNRSHFSANMEKNLVSFVGRLREIDAVFSDKLFDTIDYSKLTKNDFVYLDPPYLITTGNYNDGHRGFTNWGSRQEQSMYDLLKKLSDNKVRYALSNVIEHKGKANSLLEDFVEASESIVHHLDFNYDNSSYNSKGRGSKEVLVTNYCPASFEVL